MVSNRLIAATSVNNQPFKFLSIGETLKDAVEAVIDQWGLELHPSIDCSDESYSAYGLKQLSPKTFWTVKVTARKSDLVDGFDFETQVLMDFGTGPIRAHVLISDTGDRINPNQRWTTSRFPQSWQKSACHPDFLFVIANSFEQALRESKEKESATKACKALCARLGAGADGAIHLPEADGSVFIRDNQAYASLVVTTQDASKIEAIMAILSEKGPS